MKWLGILSGVTLFILGLWGTSQPARAGLYSVQSTAGSYTGTPPRHKVRIRYKRRYGRQYGRRISAFVRRGPYASRRMRNQPRRKKYRYFR